MTILAAAQLKHVDTAYDFKTKKVRQEVIDDSLRHLKGRYSEGFVEALRVLLSQEEAKRPTFVELDDEIKAYRSDIRAKAVTSFVNISLIFPIEPRKDFGGPKKTW